MLTVDCNSGLLSIAVLQYMQDAIPTTNFAWGAISSFLLRK